VDRPQTNIATRSRTATALALLLLGAGCYGSSTPPEDGTADFPDGSGDVEGAEDRGGDRDDVGDDLLVDMDTFADEVPPDVVPDSDVTADDVATDDADVTDTGTHCVGTPRPCSSHLDLWACEDSGCTWDPYARTCTGYPPPCEDWILDSACRAQPPCEWV
jgi:hypothetical protein